MALVFVKLGGSLITEKTLPYTPRMEKITDLAAQIALALSTDSSLQLVLGHGSGSFGHEAASAFATQKGVSGPQAWRGFAEVWYQASRLNRLVVEALRQAGLPVLTISPAAAVTVQGGTVSAWDIRPLRLALSNGLLPVIHGDVAFDEHLGGTILSTEALFAHLARELQPERILLAGHEEGVWADFPRRQELLREITPGSLPRLLPGLGNAAGADVTGGMRSKVIDMLSLVEGVPHLEIQIFSAEGSGALARAIAGEPAGTCLHR